MTYTDTPLHARHQHDQRSPAEEIEHVASETAVAARGTLSVVDVTAVVLLGLLVCPPLMILVVVVVVPLLVIALVVGLVAAVLWVPYLLVHRLRGHHGGHASLLGHRLRRAGRALHDLAPHRIVADARKVHSGR
jgi:multidrug efflux pump subunit AcrB